jgi:hypothetical protein
MIKKIPINLGNVSMKDPQGIFSFEAACTSCRDGYVRDAHDSVWKHRGHTTYKKPSNNIRIPEMLTLSHRAICIDCHGQKTDWRSTDFKKKEMIMGLRPQ